MDESSTWTFEQIAIAPVEIMQMLTRAIPLGLLRVRQLGLP